ncbi:MAG: alpha/beta fold hydrolase [Holdemanella sp.]|nr:alpha/beta fold hydrolase [Holdemanella sp.]
MERYFNINEAKHSIKCKLYAERFNDIHSVIIFCHGFGGHKDNNAAYNFAQKTIKKHKDIVLITFNWPCHGDDVKKKLRLEDCDMYLHFVLKYVQEIWKDVNVYCYGTSFGGYLTLKYIKEHGNPFKKIALRSPAVCMYDVLKNRILSNDDWDRLQGNKEVSAGFDKKIFIDKQYVEQLKHNDITQYDYIDLCEDILFIHGSEDEIVPFETVYDFSNDNIIELVVIEGAEHRFRNVDHMNQANEAIWKFFGI